ncbi:hypothetical protein SAMN04488498_114105 [Mesorhizobium albiziae]|uniref:Uncharacterized protein n=1 Tax=Neomesorhizobium albiziae TaxID=335020 RepID=A0A1I4CT91_9HYPH|nr:hypothetical protein [Mesorhizobium albiziae]GLS31029.1 hypothetical protein GCM10007937_27380 [Mesorhizobium albiziae]SFK84508.1 hypothetical protein SAMN04488498_114105 [Mesorhizobium albiziae]
MEKRPIDMKDKELREAIEQAEMIMFIATDFAKTETEPAEIVIVQLARIRLIRQEIEARRFRGKSN